MSRAFSQQFHAALIYLLEEEGRGAQTRLASEQQIDRGYLNSIVKQRKAGSGKIREKIAGHFKMTFAEMLELGRKLLEDGDQSTLKKGEKDGVGLSPKLPEVLQEGGVEKREGFSGSEKVLPDIPGKIVKVIEILGAGDQYGKLLSELIDAVHDMASVKNENKMLTERLHLMESRLALLEEHSETEKESMQKIA
jgi:hypothetical protein